MVQFLSKYFGTGKETELIKKKSFLELILRAQLKNVVILGS